VGIPNRKYSILTIHNKRFVRDKMTKRREQPNREFEQTLFALLIALLGGSAVSFYFGSALLDLQSIDNQNARKLPGWQVSMGSICLGMIAFVVILFCLEILSKRSKIAGWRSSWPWLPLVGLTALATFVHIPAYFVIPAGAIHGTWAYRRIYRGSGRSTPRSR
jgi:hypothetical protein